MATARDASAAAIGEEELVQIAKESTLICDELG
jgi:hypothetical protein